MELGLKNYLYGMVLLLLSVYDTTPIVFIRKYLSLLIRYLIS